MMPMSTPIKELAYTIVNELFDEAKVPEERRKEVNDICAAFMEHLLLNYASQVGARAVINELKKPLDFMPNLDGRHPDTARGIEYAFKLMAKMRRERVEQLRSQLESPHGPLR